MATLYDNKTTTTPTDSSSCPVQDRNAEIHNSGISDAYRFLAETVDRQLSEIKNAREATRSHSATIEIERPAPTEKIAPKTVPAVEPKREETPYVRERVDSDLFRAETLDRAIYNHVYREESYVPAEMPMAEVKEVAIPSPSVEGNAHLSTFAKTVMAVFAASVVMMFSLICINTQVLNQKAVRISQLEQTHNELVTKNIQLRKQIEEVTSEDAIEEFALSNGMVKAE